MATAQTMREVSIRQPSLAPSNAPSTTHSTENARVPKATDGDGDRNATPFEAVYATITWEVPTAIKRAEDGCLSGNAFACLGLGELARTLTDEQAARTRSQSYFERAFSILVLKCNKREPDACVAIARMHHLGCGIRKDTEAEAALVARARELCRTKPGKVCASWMK